jgi:hypothetical protein
MLGATLHDLALLHLCRTRAARKMKKSKAKPSTLRTDVPSSQHRREGFLHDCFSLDFRTDIPSSQYSSSSFGFSVRFSRTVFAVISPNGISVRSLRSSSEPDISAGACGRSAGLGARMFAGEMTWRCLSGLRLVRYPPDSNMCDNKQEFLRLLMARSRFVIKMVNTYDSKPNISDNLH